MNQSRGDAETSALPAGRAAFARARLTSTTLQSPALLLFGRTINECPQQPVSGEQPLRDT